MTSLLTDPTATATAAASTGGSTGAALFPRVLFDEAHSQAWSVRPDVVQRMNPGHPADAGYLQAADTLRRRGLTVTSNDQAPLGAETLAAADVLVLAHPADPSWERTTGSGSPLLTSDECQAVEDFVLAGGGLVVLGECEQDKYGNNLNELLARFGIQIVHGTVQDRETSLRDVAAWVRADSCPAVGGEDLLASVSEVVCYRSGWLSVDAEAHVLLRTSGTADPAGAPLAATATRGAGRVVVLADSDLFGDDSIHELDHTDLWQNIVFWAAGGRPTATTENTAADSTKDAPAWHELKSAVSALRPMQAKDGSVDGAEHDLAEAGRLVERVVAAIAALAPRFPDDASYLTAVVEDFRRWAGDGFGVPDFLDSLQQLHPESPRVDGREHLVVFPMYTQNGNPDRNVEAVLFRTVWPDWVAELEAGKYDNPMFVPIAFIDFTAGYDTNSAVLFPETVAVRETPKFTWGAIFCDREAARFRAVAGAAAQTLRLSPPPDAARLLVDQQLAQNTFILWDLIHDRTHSHGDLPFDPFMIKQRMPYWMYALEELRCDLTTFREAIDLERRGVPYGRLVQYAILFDRLFRFPITGGRIKNYDGLGGQLLFAYLRRHGALRWTDNTLKMVWDSVPEVVVSLCEDVEKLYADGIDRSRVAHWLAAHTLVASYVEPHPASVWAKGIDSLPIDGPLKPLNDAVLTDEFPLNTFYEALDRKLKDVVASTAGITG